MNIRVEAASRRRHDGPEIKTKTFNNILDTLCFKITHGPLIIGYALDNQSAPIGRKVKWLATHGACGVGRTRALPAIHTSRMEHVTAWQCTIRLVRHRPKTY